MKIAAHTEVSNWVLADAFPVLDDDVDADLDVLDVLRSSGCESEVSFDRDEF